MTTPIINIQEAYILADKYPLPELVMTKSPFPESLLIFRGPIFDHIEYEYDPGINQKVPMKTVFRDPIIINNVIDEVTGTRVLTGFMENGKLNPIGNVLLPNNPDGQRPYDSATVHWSNDPKYDREMMLFIDAVIFALNLMNCKNIKYIPYDPNKALSRQVRRHREREKHEPYSKYKILEIQPIKERALTNGRPKQEPRNNHRLHTVRGHFKTYTTEKPLFGKYTGTYWWGNCVKGNPEIGSIEKDYCLLIDPDDLGHFHQKFRGEAYA